MKIFLILLMSLTLTTRTLFAFSMTGILYDKDSKKTKELYRWTRTESGDAAHLEVKFKFTDAAGTIVAEEGASLENSSLKEYRVNQRQTDQSGKLIVKDKKLNFEYTRNGKPETNQEDEPGNLVVPPTVVDYLIAHWDKITGGESVAVRLAVLDRKETVGFEFFKVKEKETEDTLVVKMKPSSIFIAAIVDPLYFTFDKKGPKLKELVGRTLPKQKVDGQWKDLDANIVYTYLK